MSCLPPRRSEPRRSLPALPFPWSMALQRRRRRLCLDGLERRVLNDWSDRSCPRVELPKSHGRKDCHQLKSNESIRVTCSWCFMKAKMFFEGHPTFSCPNADRGAFPFFAFGLGKRPTPSSAGFLIPKRVTPLLWKHWERVWKISMLGLERLFRNATNSSWPNFKPFQLAVKRKELDRFSLKQRNASKTPRKHPVQPGDGCGWVGGAQAPLAPDGLGDSRRWITSSPFRPKRFLCLLGDFCLTKVPFGEYFKSFPRVLKQIQAKRFLSLGPRSFWPSRLFWGNRS